MKVKSKLVEVELSPDEQCVTVQFPATKMVFTITSFEAEELMVALSRLIEE